MTEKIQELRAVLDMPIADQMNVLMKLKVFSSKEYVSKCFSLADLAFRLRDEAAGIGGNTVNLGLGMWYVYRRVQYQDHRFDYPPCETEKGLARSWFAYYDRPIDRIIAALIAKELNKET